MLNKKEDHISKLNPLEIALEVTKKNNASIPIYDLLNQVCSICKIDSKDYEKISQLYLYINLSAKFIFCGDGWLIKENKVNLWDQEYLNFDEDEK